MEYLNIIELRNQVNRKRLKFTELKNRFDNESEYKGNFTDVLLVSAIDLIVTTSKKMSLYNSKVQGIDVNLFNEIINLNQNELHKIANESYMDGAISIIRYVIAQMFIKQEVSSAQDLKDKIEQLKNDFINKNIQAFEPYLNEHTKSAINFIKNYDKANPFQSWGPLYRYLLPFVYDIELRNTIWIAIEIIRDELLKHLNIKDSWESKNSQGWYNKVRSYFGFEGPSNYGSQRAVLMLHPKNIPDHKNAVQLVCYFSQGKISAGCDTGVNVNSENLLDKLGNWEKIIDFDFNNYCNEVTDDAKIKQKFSEIVEFLKSNLDFAKKNNEQLIKLNPSIRSAETAEGNAELSSGNDINLYDPYDALEKNESKSIENTLKIKNAKQTSPKKIYPNIKKTEDYLDRKKIGKYLANEIISNKNIEPLNIGIYANWGSGKTQIFYFIKEFLNSNKKNDKQSYNCEIIDFDAWMYDDQERIWANLIMTILNHCNKHHFFYLRYTINKFARYFSEHWQEILIKFFMFVVVFIFIGYINLTMNFPIVEKIFELDLLTQSIIILLLTIMPELSKIGFVKIDKEFLKCFKLPSYKEQLGFKNEIQNLVDFALYFLSNNGKKRIVLFIDNLDRCSHNNIKQILDSICQFLEICKTPNTNLISVFAMDEDIIKNALIKEGIPDSKTNEYLEKIINLPVYPKMPEEINMLINRFFGEEDNDVKPFLKNKYKTYKYNPRKLANVRYLDHMVYNIYGEFLNYNDIDLFELMHGKKNTWEYLTNNEKIIKYEKELQEINKNISGIKHISMEKYKEIENKALSYIQNLYGYEINSNIRIKDINNFNKKIMLDGIVSLQEKDILLEVKYVNDNKRIKQIFSNTVEQLISGANMLNSIKKIELILIIVVDNIENKQVLLKDLNIELQKILKSTKYSGIPIILNSNEL